MSIDQAVGQSISTRSDRRHNASVIDRKITDVDLKLNTGRMQGGHRGLGPHWLLDSP